MIVYRISLSIHAGDLSGTGAGLHGGRWNPRGVNMVYSAESRALAALELYANRSSAAVLANLSLVSIVIPDDIAVKRIREGDLPRGWNRYPAAPELPDLGAAWVGSRETLVLCVPSALMPRENNYLINPAHADMSRIHLGEIEEYRFDQRFLT